MVVSRDMRPHSPSLAKSLTDGIRSTGMDVIDIGMVDTPMNYFAINAIDCVGGIQVTAFAQSHRIQRLQNLWAESKAHRLGQRSGRYQAHRPALCEWGPPA